MKIAKYIPLFFSLSVFSQQKIKVELITKTEVNYQNLVTIDKYKTTYSFDDNTLYVSGEKGNLEYSNLQLGTLTKVDASNPLKLNLFYDDFNTVVVLDNRLSDIFKIDFNTLKPFRDISHMSSAYDNDIWIFNMNSSQLELFNYISNNTKFTSLPIEGKVLDITSNYNYCWLLTSNYIYTFNYFGNLISKEENKGFTKIKNKAQDLFLLQDNKLLLKKNNTQEYAEINIPELLINQFFVNDETLYIYDGKILYHYQLIND